MMIAQDECTAGMFVFALIWLSALKKKTAHDVKGMEVKSGTLSFCVRSYSACEKSKRQAWAEKWKWR